MPRNQEFMSEQLMRCWEEAIGAVNGRASVKSALTSHLTHQENTFDYLIAIGKAASQMALGAYDVLPTIRRGFVVTKRGHVDATLRRHTFGLEKGLEILEAGHPIPDQQSLDAGARLISFIYAIPANGKIIMLISGGASSLVEVLPEGMSLFALQALNTMFMSSGLPIEKINAVRQSLSMIKGGKLARYIDGRDVLALMISDVPGDQLDVIGSGLVSASRHPQLPELPPEFKNLSPLQNLGPTPSDRIFNTIESIIVANNPMACEAAMNAGLKAGNNVIYDRPLFQEDVSIVAEKIWQQLRKGREGISIFGGESTIVLPDSPGRGGRNQALALLLAQKISGMKGLNILVAGTDGSDGPTDAAGAWVSGDTINEGKLRGLDANDFYQKANAYRYFDQIGALFKSGPTGTNVMDIVIALRAY